MSRTSKRINGSAAGDTRNPAGISVHLLGLGLTLVTLLLFLPAYWCDFIYLDDYEYVMANPPVQAGLSWAGIKWAATAFHASNWHPLTWLSHMVDCTLFGVNPGPHHLVNVLLHVVNSTLVMLLWDKLTGRRILAFFIGALFAWHPLRLESVVWIAERKDVLSALFGLGALYCYVGYAQAASRGQPKLKPETLGWGRRQYWLALFLLVLGLLAKPMLVTIPCVMLLLDFWPLQRREKPWRLVWEKAPFFLLSALSGLMTIFVQRREAIVSVEVFPWSLRLDNALISYLRYLGKLIYPVDLAVFYPMPLQYPAWQVTGAVLGLTGISFWVWRERQRQPWGLVGWCWYLGMLVPVIGLIQVGVQSCADRYTYWPAIGLSAAVVFAANQVVEKMSAMKWPLLALGVATVLACAGLTAWQMSYWRNAETLGARALQVTANNSIAHQIRGRYYGDHERLAEALVEFQQAVQISDDYHWDDEPMTNQVPLPREEDGAFQQAQRSAKSQAVRPLLAASGPVHNDLGNVFAKMGRPTEALRQYQRAIELMPQAIEPYNNLAVTLAELGHYSEALAAHAKAVALAPDSARTHYLNGKTYWRMGRAADAIVCFRRALELSPQDYQSLTLLAQVLASTPEVSLRNGAEALRCAQLAVALTRQQQPRVLDVLAMAYAEQGNFAAAQQTIAQALTLADAAQATNLVVELQMHAAAFAAQQPWRNTNAPAGPP